MTCRRLLPAVLSASALAFLVSGCAVTGVEGSVGYDGGYYEPYGYDYGGWGVGYRVGPSRCCARHDDHHDHPVARGRVGRSPAYRPAPVGRPAPSIPGRPRSR
ncbi:MAG TPA: hypothetical protein VN815_05095 [Steroidobacteraceae bacterium]|jgi:hypothetical protein|nr:hypothetical protein [Steroidobacteraceae bacterium]